MSSGSGGEPAVGEEPLPMSIEGVDWSSTPLGPPEGWPRGLATMARIMLGSRFSMWLGWGPDLLFVYNDAYRRDTLGIKHPWALGRPAREVWAEIWDDVGPRVEKVMATGVATWDESLLLFLERSGYREETYHTFSYSPLPGDGGAVEGLLCVVAEETVRVIGERRMATLRRLANGLAGTDDEALVIEAVEAELGQNGHDLPFTLGYLLEGAGQARLAWSTGFPAEHPLAPTEVDLADPAAPWPLADAVRTGGPAVVALVGRDAPPTGAWAEPPARAVVVPLLSAGTDGGVAGFLVAGTNRYRPLDEEQHGFIELVAGQIASALARARAHGAERARAAALARLDEAKTAFFQNTSHELRTPLTLILGPLAELAGAELAEEDAAHLDMARSNAARLLKLVDSLLEFSRIEGGPVQAQVRPTDLAALTDQLASMFRAAAEAGGLDLVVDCPRLPRPVEVDPSMWERVVVNLVANAIKFTLAGSITVRLRDGGGGAELVVADTGEGIAPEELPHIFTRFHRVKAVRARTHEGAGIGLALVDELVRLHGGTVSAQSEPGAGTTFRVWLPYGSGEGAGHPIDAGGARDPGTGGAATPASGSLDTFVREAASWTASRAVPPGAPAGGEEGHRHRVLVVDDNADMRSYLRKLLEPQYDVEEAEDGQVALAALSRRTPDVVITDAMMPVADGFELLRRLRGERATANVAVIMLSARAGEESAVEGLARGADDYLVKPFSARELLARVRAALEGSRRREAELRNREAEAERFAELSQAFLGIAGADGYMRRVNPAYTRVLGWTEEELLTRPFMEFVHPADRDWLAEEIPTLFAGKADGQYQVRVLHRDGSTRVALVHLKAIPEEGVLYAAGTDITQRHRAEAVVAIHAAVLDMVARGEELNAVLERLSLAVEQLAPGWLASALVLDDDGVHLRLGGAPSLPDAYNRGVDGLTVGPQAGSCGTAAFRREPVVVVDVQTDPLWTDFRELAGRHGLRACWSTPIMSADGDVLGTFALYHGEPRQPGAVEREAVEAATDLARVAIERERAERRLRRSEHRFRTVATQVPVGIFQADAAGNNIFANDHLCGIVGRAAPDLLGQRWTEHVHPDDRARVVAEWEAAVGAGEAWSSQYRVVRPSGEERLVAAAARPLSEPGREPEGFLGSYVDRTEAEAAAEAERRFRQQRDIATTLQRSLMAGEPPAIPGVSVATRYLSGGAGVEVGGDWFDVFLLPGGRVGVAVGDVVGRGLPAAVVMGKLRTALAALAAAGDPPAVVLDRLSGLAETLAGDQMATVVYGIVDPEAQTLCYSAAGHPPPLLVDATGTTLLADGRGLPLGVAAGRRDEAATPIPPGATLLLYTDGLIERRGELLDEGLERLRQAAAGGAGDLDMLCDRVLTELDAEAAGDDVAVVALRLQQAGNRDFDLTVEDGPRSLGPLRRSLRRWLTEAGADAEEAHDVVLAVGEAVTNALVHAHGLDGGTVGVSGRHEDGEITVVVADQGQWREPSAGDGGRGLPLMAALVDSAVVRPGDTGTEVVLTHRLGRPRRARDRLAPAAATTTKGIDVVDIAGEVDLAGCEELSSRLDRALRGAVGGLVLDLSRCRYLDSAAMRVLFSAARTLVARRQHLRIVVPPGSPVRRVLEVTGFLDVAPLSATVDAARAAVEHTQAERVP